MQYKLVATLLSSLSISRISAAAPVTNTTAVQHGKGIVVEFCQGQMLAAPCVTVHVPIRERCYEIPDSNRFGDRGSSFRIVSLPTNDKLSPATKSVLQAEVADYVDSAWCQMYDGHDCTGWIGPKLSGVAKWDDSSTGHSKYNIYRSFICSDFEGHHGDGVYPGGPGDPDGGKGKK